MEIGKTDRPATRQEWLKERLSGIGASEAAAVLGMSPYTTNEELWEIKTGRRVQEDISDKPFVRYGIYAEVYLRQLFALDFPQYKIGYETFRIINNEEFPFIFATLDGWLEDAETGHMGVLEIKTTEIMQSGQWRQWDDKVPDHYYVQCLHQLLATGYDFAILKAQIKYHKGDDINLTTRHYRIDREDVADDLDYLLAEEIKFWQAVTTDTRPATMLPQI